MREIRLHPDDKICILRSGQLGDWMVTIPFLCYLIYIRKIKKENIFSLIISSHGFNPIKVILGEKSIISQNSYCINISNIFTLLRSIKTANKKLPKDIKVLFYLPFSKERHTSILKKRLLCLFFYKIKQKYGLNDTKEELVEDSNYISYFNKLGINDIPDKKLNKMFLFDEGILENLNDTKSNNISIYPNSKLKMKIWPANNYIKIIEYILTHTEKLIYLLGGIEDREYNENIVSKFEDNERLINIAGKYNIPQTINILSNCQLLIGNDGAPIHMASLVNTPIIGLYTFKEPIFSWEPLSSKYITYRTNVTCKHCFKATCTNPVCIEHIDYDHVIAGISEIMTDSFTFKQQIIVTQSKIGLSYKSV